MVYYLNIFNKIQRYFIFDVRDNLNSNVSSRLRSIDIIPELDEVVDINSFVSDELYVKICACSSKRI